MKEKTIAKIKTVKPIGCCGGHVFKLISVNHGFTTECDCGCWCGQWFDNTGQAVEYFMDMIERHNKEVNI